MKLLFSFLLSAMTVGCGSKQGKQADVAQDEDLVKKEITEFHQTLKRAYNGGHVNTDSLCDAYFDHDSYYVTAWGTSELLDSTKKRLRVAIPHVRDYDNRIENLNAKVYGDGAYAFFILRQDYSIDGHLVEEYLPTTFVLERRDGTWVVVHSQKSTDYETMQKWVELSKMREQQARARTKG